MNRPTPKTKKNKTNIWQKSKNNQNLQQTFHNTTHDWLVEQQHALTSSTPDTLSLSLLHTLRALFAPLSLFTFFLSFALWVCWQRNNKNKRKNNVFYWRTIIISINNRQQHRAAEVSASAPTRVQGCLRRVPPYTFRCRATKRAPMALGLSSCRQRWTAPQSGNRSTRMASQSNWSFRWPLKCDRSMAISKCTKYCTVSRRTSHE